MDAAIEVRRPSPEPTKRVDPTNPQQVLLARLTEAFTDTHIETIKNWETAPYESRAEVEGVFREAIGISLGGYFGVSRERETPAVIFDLDSDRYYSGSSIGKVKDVSIELDVSWEYRKDSILHREPLLKERIHATLYPAEVLAPLLEPSLGVSKEICTRWAKTLQAEDRRLAHEFLDFFQKTSLPPQDLVSRASGLLCNLNGVLSRSSSTALELAEFKRSFADFCKTTIVPQFPELAKNLVANLKEYGCYENMGKLYQVGKACGAEEETLQLLREELFSTFDKNVAAALSSKEAPLIALREALDPFKRFETSIVLPGSFKEEIKEKIYSPLIQSKIEEKIVEEFTRYGAQADLKKLTTISKEGADCFSDAYRTNCAQSSARVQKLLIANALPQLLTSDTYAGGPIEYFEFVRAYLSKAEELGVTVPQNWKSSLREQLLPRLTAGMDEAKKKGDNKLYKIYKSAYTIAKGGGELLLECYDREWKTSPLIKARAAIANLLILRSPVASVADAFARRSDYY